MLYHIKKTLRTDWVIHEYKLDTLSHVNSNSLLKCKTGKGASHHSGYTQNTKYILQEIKETKTIIEILHTPLKRKGEGTLPLPMPHIYKTTITQGKTLI